MIMYILKIKISTIIINLPLLLTAILSLLSFSVIALDKNGHQIVCQLAYNNLPSSEKLAIDSLLNKLPEQHKHLINQYNHHNKNETITFAKSCTWADAIKKLDEYKKFNSSHYLNVSRDSTTIDKSSCQQLCITQAINLHLKQLEQAENNWQKLQALMFLGHWLGDIHQPLHISYESDKGGNTIQIDSKSKCKTLHWYWDECLLKSNKQRTNEIVTLLQSQWLANQEKTLALSTVNNWANESYQIVRQANMQYCQLKNNVCLANKQRVIIDENYQQTFLPILQQQLLKAAIRLHKLLTDIKT